MITAVATAADPVEEAAPQDHENAYGESDEDGRVKVVAAVVNDVEPEEDFAEAERQSATS
jgi:hypothetical protein